MSPPLVMRSVTSAVDDGNMTTRTPESPWSGLSPIAGTALPVGDPAGGSLDLKSETSLLGLVNTVVK